MKNGKGSSKPECYRRRTTRDLVERGPFLTSQVVVYVGSLCLLASGLGALSIIVRVAGD